MNLVTSTVSSHLMLSLGSWNCSKTIYNKTNLYHRLHDVNQSSVPMAFHKRYNKTMLFEDLLCGSFSFYSCKFSSVLKNISKKMFFNKNILSKKSSLYDTIGVDTCQ